MVRRSVVAGCGAYLPDRVVTNEELVQRVDTTDEWIVQRTGIKTRHIAGDDQKTSDLAIAAARQALEHAGMDASELDLVVLATATPDHTFPSTATTVQASLGMTRGAAFDVQAVCSGFVYAMNVADNFVRLGQAENVLVIGAETFSRILDWEDRRPAFCSVMVPVRSSFWARMRLETAAIVAYWLIACILTAVIMIYSMWTAGSVGDADGRASAYGGPGGLQARCEKPFQCDWRGPGNRGTSRR